MIFSKKCRNIYFHFCNNKSVLSILFLGLQIHLYILIKIEWVSIF